LDDVTGAGIYAAAKAVAEFTDDADDIQD
jgi:hypothetical protein